MRQHPSTCGARPGAGRRRWLRCACAIAAWPFAGAHRGAWAQSYPVTVAAMRAAHEDEMRVHYRYTEFARQAQQEGYRGIAYLFVAFAAAEMI